MEINNRKTVFISGKVTGTTDYRERFAAAERIINGIPGFIAVNPIKVHDGIPEGAFYRLYMDVSLVLLDYCEVIYMLPGWEDSLGAQEERKFAEENGIRIVEDLEDL